MPSRIRRSFLPASATLLALLLLPAAGLGAAKPATRPEAAPPSLLVAPAGEPGERLTVSGTLVDDAGRPIAGAELHVYQTDAGGRYTPDKPMDEGHARLAGRLKTGADGRFELRTIRPGGYAKPVVLAGVERKIPAHIHIDVRAAGHAERHFQLVFADDPRLAETYWADWVKKQRHPVLDARRHQGAWTGTLVLRLE